VNVLFNQVYSHTSLMICFATVFIHVILSPSLQSDCSPRSCHQNSMWIWWYAHFSYVSTASIIYCVDENGSFSGMLVHVCQTTQCHIPEDSNLYNYNLRITRLHSFCLWDSFLNLTLYKWHFRVTNKTIQYQYIK